MPNSKKVLPRFVFIAPNASEPTMGAGFVLETVKPFTLAQIIKFTPENYIMAQYEVREKYLATADVPGHSIMLVFAGNIEGYRVLVQSASKWDKHLTIIVEKMANWFFYEKIMNNLKYYKKYKI